MALYQELIDFKTLFNQLTITPVIINDLPYNTDDEKEQLLERLTTIYSADKISTVPSCDCGASIGEFRVGEICHVCNTRVLPKVEESIDPVLWFRKPEGMIALINPFTWGMLSRAFSRNKFNLVHWICDSRYDSGIKPPASLYSTMNFLIEKGVQRDYNWFVANFDMAVELLATSPGFKGSYRANVPLIKHLEENRGKLFSDYIPLPNKLMVVMERKRGVNEVEPGTVRIVDVFNTLAGLDKSSENSNLSIKVSRSLRAIDKLYEYYDEFIRRHIGSRGSIIRHHILSTRAHFSFRAVIVSITEPHEYDEIHTPWGVALGLLEYHILNKLFKMDYVYEDAIKLINESTNVYNPMLGAILDKIISESPVGGIPVLFNRNPALNLGSVQLVRITKIKKNPLDTTIAFSILSTVPPNAKQQWPIYQ